MPHPAGSLLLHPLGSLLSLSGLQFGERAGDTLNQFSTFFVCNLPEWEIGVMKQQVLLGHTAHFVHQMEKEGLD